MSTETIRIAQTSSGLQSEARSTSPLSPYPYTAFIAAPAIGWRYNHPSHTQFQTYWHLMLNFRTRIS